MMLEARDITVRIGHCPIIDTACLTLMPGEVVGFLGPNGAGKSTLLRAVAGVIGHEGTVTLQGRPAAGLTRRERARMLAYLPQQGRVEWAISVREVVALGRHAFAASPADTQAVDAAMAQTGIASIADRSAKVVSGGELARVLLARALAAEAPLLLADEPVAGLDPFQQLAVMEILRNRAASGTGVLAVLHDLTLAARFCDRVIVMHEGRIVGNGPPHSVLTAPLLEQVFRISPLVGDHAGERWVLPWTPLER